MQPLSILGQQHEESPQRFISILLGGCGAIPIAAYCQGTTNLSRGNGSGNASYNNVGSDWVLRFRYFQFGARHPET
jgi:hypothetical protein